MHLVCARWLGFKRSPHILDPKSHYISIRFVFQMDWGVLKSLGLISQFLHPATTKLTLWQFLPESLVLIYFFFFSASSPAFQWFRTFFLLDLFLRFMFFLSAFLRISLNAATLRCDTMNRKIDESQLPPISHLPQRWQNILLGRTIRFTVTFPWSRHHELQIFSKLHIHECTKKKKKAAPNLE